MEEIEFYDVKTKGKFKTADYRLVLREKEGKSGKVSKRRFAVAKSLAGEHECWKVVSAAFYEANQ
jgi:hypothetical protein